MKYILTILILLSTTDYAFSESPYELSWHRDASLLLTGVCGIAFSNQLGHTLRPLTKSDVAKLSPEKVNRFDRIAIRQYSQKAAKLSDWSLYQNAMLPVLMLFDSRATNDCEKLGIMFLESHMLNFALTGITKDLVKRARPYVYNSSVPLRRKLTKNARRSFFSGHTSVAFTGAALYASLYSEYHPESRWKTHIWILSLTSASITGYLRVRAGKHFPSDVIAGAIAGTLSGLLVPEFHVKDNATGQRRVTVPLFAVSMQF
ncbi:MAG: phosphatase PAP2 family protein [candidate division KSB1 bacterium]|jgi:hypothetical protein|nr:phosphatase PAP2 family protein [candidate division KSB1 bacterium]